MRSPVHGNLPPFTLASNVVYFHDWRYVKPGDYAWRSESGESVPMMGPGKVPAMRYEPKNLPMGVSLRAQPAQKSDVVLSARKHKHVGLFGGSLIHEEGRYRLWYESWLKQDFDQPDRVGIFNALRYAESDDGMNWRLPAVGDRRYRDEKHHNVVYGSTLTPRTGFHGGCVFKDPSAPPSQRYKAFHLGKVHKDVVSAYLKRRPGDADLMSLEVLGRRDWTWGLYGATSPDGMKWHAIRDPLLMQNSDTHNVCEYDADLGMYVAYVRTWVFHRRTIGRAVAQDFRHFEFPEEVFWPDASQAPYDTWYVNGKTRMPGAPDYHIMFPMRWSLPTDRFDFHLAASPDNVIWGMVPGGPVCEPGSAGSWDGGVVAPGMGMVALPGDRIGILYAATPVPHKYPRRPPFGELAWATWPTGRLVALQCPLEGRFCLHPLRFAGRTVRLNHRTGMTGFIKVEARVDRKVLPGRAFEDCDTLRGDHLDQMVTWKGQSDLGHADGQAVELAFQLRDTDLFSVRFESSRA